MKENLVTIFIHGTLPPKTLLALPRVGAFFKCPPGLTNSTQLNPTYLAGSIQQLEGDTVYTFGWSGNLSAQARKKAAADLAAIICSLKDPSNLIRLVTHSHGGNVALYLAEQGCTIDELILLACPVQTSTAPYVHDPCFKKVYSLHSHSDIMQVLDPQGLPALFNTLKKHGIEFTLAHLTKLGPLFSSRHFTPERKLKQMKVTHPNRPFLHIEFVLPSFIKKLPQLLATMDKTTTEEQITQV